MKTFKAVLSIIFIPLGLLSLYYQGFYFIFSAFNRRAGDDSATLTHTFPHLFSLAIIIWFIISQIKILKRLHP